MSSPIDPIAFEKLRRIAPHQLAARREPSAAPARPLPEEIAFKLTNRCDLRCSHCYQWGEAGYHRSLPQVDRGGDLPLEVVAQVLEATRPVRSNVFLWGGEPLVYRAWDGLVDLLAAHERWTSLCTNGTLIERRLDGLVRLSRYLEVSISIDGFEAENDRLRGAGAFARTMAGLDALVAAKRGHRYQGEISVNCVLSDDLVPRLLAFVRCFEEKGVDTIYLSFPWFISPATASRMDGYVAEHFPDLSRTAAPSWHSFTFGLDPTRLATLRTSLAELEAAELGVKLRFNPALGGDDLEPFIRGSHEPAQNKSKCLALGTRLDVFPSGDVVSCKFFPEFFVGNLARDTLADVWHGPRYERVRQTVAACGLMPVCAKCNLLYTRGA
jgi:radical SAM protein with 4Fe4S-binding SPASM domain